MPISGGVKCVHLIVRRPSISHNELIAALFSFRIIQVEPNDLKGFVEPKPVR
jgi:hypothetical protein